MKFPRPVKRIGRCLAIICDGKGRPGKHQSGEPITTRRPRVKFNGETWKANRLSFRLNKQKITCTPSSHDDLVLHTCDHDWCIEPEHLYRGSQIANVRDMYERHPTIRQKLTLASTGRTNVWSAKSRREKSKAMRGNKNAKGHRLNKQALTKISRALKSAWANCQFANRKPKGATHAS